MPSTYQPAAFPRQWLPADATLETWADIEPWYRRLEQWQIGSAADLTAWMKAKDELDAAAEPGSRPPRY